MYFISHSPEETKKIAVDFVNQLHPGSVVGLIGELGSGKTTFVQGLAEGLGMSRKYYISSPTFTLLNEYEGPIPLFHFDLYRVESLQELESLGFEEYWEGMGDSPKGDSPKGDSPKGISVIEWAEKLPPAFQGKMTVVRFKIDSPTTRRLEITLREPP